MSIQYWIEHSNDSDRGLLLDLYDRYSFRMAFGLEKEVSSIYDLVRAIMDNEDIDAIRMLMFEYKGYLPIDWKNFFPFVRSSDMNQLFSNYGYGRIHPLRRHYRYGSISVDLMNLWSKRHPVGLKEYDRYAYILLNTLNKDIKDGYEVSNNSSPMSYRLRPILEDLHTNKDHRGEYYLERYPLVKALLMDDIDPFKNNIHKYEGLLILSVLVGSLKIFQLFPENEWMDNMDYEHSYGLVLEYIGSLNLDHIKNIIQSILETEGSNNIEELDRIDMLVSMYPELYEDEEQPILCACIGGGSIDMVDMYLNDSNYMLIVLIANSYGIGTDIYDRINIYTLLTNRGYDINDYIYYIDIEPDYRFTHEEYAAIGKGQTNTYYDELIAHRQFMRNVHMPDDNTAKNEIIEFLQSRPYWDDNMLNRLLDR